MLKKKIYIDVEKYWISNSTKQVTLKDTTIFPLLLKQIMSDMAERLIWKLMAIYSQELEDKQVK